MSSSEVQATTNGTYTDEVKPSWKEEKRGLVGGFVHLFFHRKFIVHRVLGLSYLLQYAASVYCFFADFEGLYLASPLWWSLPVTGLVQSFTATYYFSFLPKKQADPGYYTATATLGYNFVKENIFYASILCFAFLYYNDTTYAWFKYFWPVEALFVFLPYTWRRIFPKTHMRNSLETTEKNKQNNKKTGFMYYFFFYLTWLTKIFYVWAKHYIGLFLNYVRFTNTHFTPEFQKDLYLIVICGAFATTIAMFLHTLRFKKYLPPVASFGLYVLSYMSTFYGYYLVAYIFLEMPLLTAAVFVGMMINVLSQIYLKSNIPFDIFQVFMMIAAYNRYGPFSE